MLRTYALDAFISALVGALTFCLLDLQTKIVFAIIISFLTFFLLTYLKSDSTLVTCKLAEFKFYPPLLVILLCEFAIITILLIPSFNNIEYVSWSNLPYINVLRLVMSVLISTFLPGYMLFNVIGKDDASKLQTLVFSIVLSLFFTSLTCLLVVFTSGIQLTIPIFITLNLILQTIYLISSFLRKKYKINHEIKFGCSKHELSEKLTLLFLIILQFAFTFSMLSANFPLPRGDETVHHGLGLIISGGQIPSSISYPFGLHLYLAVVFLLSGFPSINTYQFLHFLNVLPILAFYVALKGYFNKDRSKIPILSVFFGFFSGFNWIYAIYLKYSGFSGNMYDLHQVSDWKMAGWPTPFYLAPYLTPAQMIDVASFLLLLFLVFSTDVYGFRRYFLMFAVTTLDFLGHVSGVVVFIVFYLALLPIFQNNALSSYRKTALSILLGLFTVTIINSIDPAHRYSGVYLLGSILLIIFAFSLGFIKEKLRFKRTTLFRIRVKSKAINLKYLLALSLAYLCGLCFIIFLNVLSEFDVRRLYFYSKLGTEAQFIPWYIYPLTLGTAGILALAGLLYLILKKNENRKHFFPFLILMLVVLSLERALRLYPVTMGGRLFTWLWISVCVFAGYAVTNLSANLHIKNNKQKVLFVILFGTIVVSGISTSLQYVEYLTVMNDAGILTYQPFEISEGELKALNHLRLNAPANASILTLTSQSAEAILGFTGLFRPIWGEAAYNIFKSQSHEIVISELLNWKVKYIYIAPRDIAFIDSNPEIEKGYIYSQAISYMPLVYRNSGVSIYEFPTLQPPTEKSNLAIITPPNENFSYFPAEILSHSSFKYSVFSENDNLRFNFSNLLLTRDLDLWNENEREQFFGYLQWIENGGNLIVFNSLGDKPPLGRGWGVENFTDAWYLEPANTSNVLTNNDVITIQSIQGLNVSGCLTLYSPDINVSVNKYQYLVIRFKSEVQFHIYLHGSKSDYGYIYLGSPTTWTTKVIDLRSFYDFVHQKNRGFDGDEIIDRILIRTEAKDVNYSIDFIRFYTYSGLTNPAFAGFLSLTSGSQTMVTGVTQDNASIRFPSVFSKITLYEANLNVTAWYVGEDGKPVSPFSLQKKLGDGYITYVEISPLWKSFQIIRDSCTRTTILTQLGAHLDVFLDTPFGICENAPSLNQTSFVYDMMEASGKITIIGDSICLSIANPSVMLKLPSGKTFSNISIEEFQINNPVVLHANEVLMEPSEGSYVTMKVVDNLTIHLPDSCEVEIKTQKYNITAKGGSLTFLMPAHTNSVMKLTIRKPELHIQGLALFDKALIFTKIRTVLVDQMALEIHGDIGFRAVYSEHNLIFLHNFAFTGTFEVPYSDAPSLTESDVPWISVVLSPFHVFFLFVIALTFVIKKKTKIANYLSRSICSACIHANNQQELWR